MSQDDEKNKPLAEPKTDAAKEADGTTPGEEEEDWDFSGYRRFYSRRWLLPALYLTAAALIIAFMYGQASRLLHTTKSPQAETPVTSTTATASQPWIWPVAADTTGVKLTKSYYDASQKGATVQTLASNLVHYDNSYQGNTGIDLGVPGSHRSFGVVAAASGVVSQVSNDPVMGETVIINTKNGYQTVYQSLGSASVKVGEPVLQGQLIGSSGYNMRESGLGNHLFFEVEKNHSLINPEALLPQATA